MTSGKGTKMTRGGVRTVGMKRKTLMMVAGKKREEEGCLLAGKKVFGDGRIEERIVAELYCR